MSVEHVSELSQQLVLVTGGARGLGACLVRAFARQGAKVVINYLKSAAAAQALADEFPQHCLAVEADVRDATAVQAVFAQAQAHFGPPFTTVGNNALTALS